MQLYPMGMIKNIARPAKKVVSVKKNNTLETQIDHGNTLYNIQTMYMIKKEIIAMSAHVSDSDIKPEHCLQAFR